MSPDQSRQINHLAAGRSFGEGQEPAGAFGPRLTATVAVYAGVYHLSKRTTAGLLADLFGVDLAVGSVTACERVASAAVATPVVQAVRHVRAQPVIHVDETGWRQRRQRAWLWVAATTLVTVFLVHARRGTGAARTLLRGTQAILVTDRWSAYQAWPLTRRTSSCWAHLRREWVAFTERGGTAWRVGHALRAETRAIFALWYRVRDGTLSRTQFQSTMRPHRRRVEAWLRQREQAFGAPGRRRPAGKSSRWPRRSGRSSRCPGSSRRTTRPSGR